MKSGDVVLKFGGEEIEDTRELVRVVADTPVGEKVEVVVFRGGKEETLTVEVGLLQDATLAAAPGGAPQGDTPPPVKEETVLGMTVAVVNDEIRQRFALDRDVTGLIVTDLDASSDAYAKGMREGDIIAEIGQEAVASPQEMQDRIDAAEQAGRNSILLLVRRDGQPRFVALNLSS